MQRIKKKLERYVKFPPETVVMSHAADVEILSKRS
jgi:hypothetical protein